MKKTISAIFVILILIIGLAACGSSKSGAGATFIDGTFIPWEKLKATENGVKYGYCEYEITDEKIGEKAFYLCNTLKSINIPVGVKTIEDSAFWSCETLESITIPNTVETIGTGVFEFSGIVELIIPEGVTHIGSISTCPKLRKVELPSSLEEFSSWFHGSSNLYYVKYNGTIDEFNKTNKAKDFIRSLGNPFSYNHMDYLECSDGNIEVKK